MTGRRRGCSSATDAIRLKRCSSTWRAAVPTWVRPRGERDERNETRHAQAPFSSPACREGQGGGRNFGAPGRRDDPALLVSPPVVMAAAPRAHLLADGADADLGFPAALCRPECGLFRTRRWHFHRRGAVVGHPVPRPARLLDLVP